MSAEFGRPVSDTALLKAFQRYKIEGTPREYVKSRQGEAAALPPPLPSPSSPPAIVLRPGGEWKDPNVSGDVTTAILSDFHIPAHDPDAINRAIELALEAGATQCVIGGDNLDVNQLSHFGRERDSVLRQEYSRLLDYIVRLDGCFKSTYMVWGNHDFRLTTNLRKNVSPAIQFLFADLLEHVANGIQYGDVSGQPIGQVDLPDVFYRRGEDGWWVRIGDCIVCHPRNYYGPLANGTDCRTAIYSYEYFAGRQDGLRAVAIGHTHTVGKTHNAERLAMEVGCLCGEMSYAKEGKINYRTKPVQGFGLLVQNDGVTDFDATRYVRL